MLNLIKIGDVMNYIKKQFLFGLILFSYMGTNYSMQDFVQRNFGTSGLNSIQKAQETLKKIDPHAKITYNKSNGTLTIMNTNLSPDQIQEALDKNTYSGWKPEVKIEGAIQDPDVIIKLKEITVEQQNRWDMPLGYTKEEMPSGRQKAWPTTRVDQPEN